MNRDSPIPTGARKVPLCFSAASICKLSGKCTGVDRNRTWNSCSNGTASGEGIIYEDCEHKLRREKHLDEQSLRLVGSPTKRSRDSKRAREQSLDDTSRCHSSEHLCNEHKKAAEEWNGTDQTKTQSHLGGISDIAIAGLRSTHSRIEETTRDSVEDPSIDSKRETKAEAYVEELCRIRALRQSGTGATSSGLRGIGYLSACKCEEPVKDACQRIDA